MNVQYIILIMHFIQKLFIYSGHIYTMQCITLFGCPSVTLPWLSPPCANSAWTLISQHFKTWLRKINACYNKHIPVLTSPSQGSEWTSLYWPLRRKVQRRDIEILLLVGLGAASLFIAPRVTIEVASTDHSILRGGYFSVHNTCVTLGVKTEGNMP